ncbi:MAG TPA: malonyl-CoA decarboxylase [Geminicoccaceae bacterium]|nr:malonyl-CoA decarboxylase [Geminicoccaceae bacterium]
MNSTFFSELLSTIADRGRSVLDREPGQRPQKRDLIQIAEVLLSSEGEASGVALAEQIAASFRALDDAGRTRFFVALAERFGPDRERLERAIARYQGERSDEAALALHAAAEPRRQELVRRLNLAPNGTAALVAMRTELLGRLEEQPSLGLVDSDFLHLLSSWFNRGFLVMRRIGWNTPAVVLEKIIRYEAVHAIHDWDDLRRRIDPQDRRCYAFFHPALVDEPLIFLEVALTEGIPAAIGPILADDREPIPPQQADTAVFYSISNCQKGLKGVSFGNFLIKQVVDDLQSDLPRLETFVTLSPVPGFARWLEAELTSGGRDLPTAPDAALLAILKRKDWPGDPEATERLKEALLPLAARYFLHAKVNGKPVDPVARFHLGNGARLERINWLGDRSDKGLRQAAGLMVNYRYATADIERNHEAYANQGKVVASAQVTKLLKTDKSTRKR